MTLTRSCQLWLVPLLALPATAAAQCPPDWLPGSPAPIFSGEFRAATLFDPDASGPAPADLIVGGNFSGLGGLFPDARILARWDGARWYPFIFSITNQGVVHALATFDFDDDGPNPPRLVVAGNFTLGFGLGVANRIFQTAGQSPTRLAEGFDSDVYDLLVFDADADGPNPPSLYAAGRFSRSGQRTIGPVARWDGSQWMPAAVGLTGSAFTLKAFDADGPGPNPPALVAGGRLTANGQSANVAILNGSTWSRLGSLDNDVADLDVFDFDADGPNPPRLVAVGTFRNTNLNGQAYYNGTTWLPIASVPAFPFATGRAITSFDPDDAGPIPARLFFGGSLPVAGQGQPAKLVELVNGAWTHIAGPDFSGDVFSLTELVPPGASDPVLFATGTLLGPLPDRLPYRLSMFEGDTLRPFGDGFNTTVRVIEPTTITGVPGLLVAGGSPSIPGVPTSDISHFNGTTWTALGNTSGSPSGITAMISYDPDEDGPLSERVVVAGYFDTISGVLAQNVAVYDGKSWAPFGATTSGFADFVLFDTDADGPMAPTLLAAQGSISGGPGTPGYIFQWNGTAWVQFGPTFTSTFGPPQITRLTTFDPDADGPAPRRLVLVGSFNRVGTLVANNAVAFDGVAWTPLGTGFDTNPQAAFTWDPNNNGHEVVVVAGGFTSAGGVPATGAAVWNGSSWSALGSGFGSSVSGFPNYPSDFAIFQGDLHAAGGFGVVTGGPGNGIARWNGAQWQPLGDALDPAAASTLGVLPASDTHPETLAVGGSFQSAGGRTSAFFARYASVPCCPADVNADGVVASDDFFAFLAAFLDANPSADFNADGVLNSDDFFAFLQAYFGVC